MRRTYTEEEKVAIATDAAQIGDRAASKKHKVYLTTINRWRRERNIQRVKKSDRVVAIGEITNNGHKAAIVYLRQARECINDDIRNGKKKQMNKSDLLTLLALDTLGGT